MYHHTTFIPDGANRPVALMGGPNGDIPVLNLDSDAGYVVLQLHPHRLDDAAVYLERLIAQATTLHGQVRRRQRQLGELLAEVERA